MLGWAVVVAVAAVVYLASAAASGALTHNGAWLVLVLVLAAAGVDALRSLLRGER